MGAHLWVQAPVFKMFAAFFQVKPIGVMVLRKYAL
jgi:hypothetical protein